jgi:hypothetical protein
VGIQHAYLFREVVQFLASVVDELVDVYYLLAINGSLLQLPHQCRNVPDFFVEACLGAVQQAAASTKCR